MATTTPNFGWPVPTSTDLVKDGATAMEALGDAIDTSMVDLKGGTTGQVLAKASNTDMDFSWTSPNPGDITAVTAGTGISGGGTSGDVTITNSMATTITTKGDLVPGTGSGTFARLAVGNNGETLVADSSASTGLSWSKNPPAGGLQVLANNVAMSGSSTITVSGISNKSRFIIFVQNASTVNTGVMIGIRFNGDSGTTYGYGGSYNVGSASTGAWNSTANQIYVCKTSTNAADTMNSMIFVDDAFSAGIQRVSVGGLANGSSAESYQWPAAYYYGSAPITSISVVSSSGNFDAGTFSVWGA